jgi:hypothetical protein
MSTASGINQTAILPHAGVGPVSPTQTARARASMRKSEESRRYYENKKGQKKIIELARQTDSDPIVEYAS